jgi:predicted metal-dependent hydrolase
MYETILVTFVILFLYIFLFSNRQNVVYIESYSGDKFMVYKDNMRKQKADLLALILKNMLILKNHMVKNIKDFPEYTTYIEQLNRNFNENRTNIYETDPTTDQTSYSVNKGEELSFCLKSKKTGQLHDINLLMYVAIHEMAHIACPEIGHGNLFKKIFRKLAEEAVNIGVYRKDNYAEHNVEYCGMILSSSII